MTTADWAEHAACAGTDPNWWYGESVSDDHRALCDACPVSRDCIDHALRHERFGIWAGTDEAMRARMRKAMRITLVEIAVDELTATVVHLAEQGTPPQPLQNSSA